MTHTTEALNYDYTATMDIELLSPEPPSELPPQMEAMNPSSPSQAEALVSDCRAEILVCAAFTTVAEIATSPKVAEIAHEAAEVARNRHGIRLAKNHTAQGEVPVDVQESIDDVHAEYAFDDEATRAVRDAAQGLRTQSAGLLTGETPKTLTKLLPSQIVETAPSHTLRSTLRRLGQKCLRRETSQANPADYYEKSLLAQELLVHDAERVDEGNLPAHTTEEIDILKTALRAQLNKKVGQQKLETQALLTRIDDGLLPVMKSPIEIARQRGKREAFARIVTATGHALIMPIVRINR